jgi:hypothetical protein
MLLQQIDRDSALPDIAGTPGTGSHPFGVKGLEAGRRKRQGLAIRVQIIWAEETCYQPRQVRLNRRLTMPLAVEATTTKQQTVSSAYAFRGRCTQSRVDRPDRRHRLERMRELAQSILKLACAFRAMDEVCIAYGTSSGSLFHWQDFGFHEVDSNAALGPHSER